MLLANSQYSRKQLNYTLLQRQRITNFLEKTHIKREGNDQLIKGNFCCDCFNIRRLASLVNYQLKV
jgi:hypothetical protein